MRRGAVLIVALAGLTALAAGAAVWLSGADAPGTDPGGAVSQQRHWSIDDARAFTEFPLYWVGEEYEGLRLDVVKRIKSEPAAGEVGVYPQDGVFFIYDDGRCQPTPGPAIEGFDSGWSCTPPLSIRVDRACLYPPGLYGSEALARLGYRRGATVLEESTGNLRAWSGDVAISIFVHDERLTASQVFDDLRPVGAGLTGYVQSLPAGPTIESVVPLDDNAVFLAGGACG